MNTQQSHLAFLVRICILLLAGATVPIASGQSNEVVSSYGPVNQDTTFDQIKAARMAVKAERAQAHKTLLSSRYDLANKTSSENLMSGGKPIPVGPTARLQGTSWKQLDKLTPDRIKEQGLFPYKPLPFADHAEGGHALPGDDHQAPAQAGSLRPGFRFARTYPARPRPGHLSDHSA
jgi:hypothetical protein